MTSPFAQLHGGVSWPDWKPSGPVRFSVVVRTQGQRPMSLEQTLRSLAVQTLAPHEVLVMFHPSRPPVEAASGCADSTVSRETVQRVADRVGFPPVEVHEVRGGGRSRPLNAALDLASGDYVCFLDDDDLAYVDWLEAFDRVIQALSLIHI